MLLVEEARVLVARLDCAIDACFEPHPHLERVVRDGMARRLRRLKRARRLAVFRLNRRKFEAGIPLTISGAMWMINQADAGYF